jgi:hypothetical protein
MSPDWSNTPVNRGPSGRRNKSGDMFHSLPLRSKPADRALRPNSPGAGVIAGRGAAGGPVKSVNKVDRLGNLRVPPVSWKCGRHSNRIGKPHCFN